LTLRVLIVAAAATFALAGLGACQSTKQRSAELEKEGGRKLLSEAGLRIEKESPVVEVISTTVLSDANGSAVVVGLRNDSDENLVDVPILIDVRDAQGKGVYSNDIPGIEPSLAHVPYIPAGGETAWVNDQVLASGKPTSVKVKVGESTDSYRGTLPHIEVSAPRVEGDPVSGLEATGTVVNRTGEEQGRLLLYALARRGDRVVAAGRGAIEHMKASTKPLHYDIFFIGEPAGGELELTQFPTLPDAQSN